MHTIFMGKLKKLTIATLYYSDAIQFMEINNFEPAPDKCKFHKCFKFSRFF